MSSISPSFRLKCRSQIFKVIGEKNFIFKMLIADYTTKALKKKGMAKMDKDDIVLKAVAILISRMEIKLTMPEDEIVKQEDDAGHVSFEEGKSRDEL